MLAGWFLKNEQLAQTRMTSRALRKKKRPKNRPLFEVRCLEDINSRVLPAYGRHERVQRDRPLVEPRAKVAP